MLSKFSAISEGLITSADKVRSPASGRGGQVRSNNTRLVLQIGEYVLLLLAIGYFAGRGLPRAWRFLNTDFPNYYVTAHLLRQGDNASRAYEWVWLQRQKDHLGIRASEQPLVGFTPHTPFSALLIWPLTYCPPLTAKRIWIILNLLFVAGESALLRSLTKLPWRRILVLVGLSYPLIRNFEYGQYYLVLLFIMTIALYLYVRDRRHLAGVAMGVACALKVFPAFFLLYFARKRDLRAISGMAVGAVASVCASVLTFGIQMHHVYLSQVLPWALRGEAEDPYNLTASSLSSLLHRLLIFEPDWNPHPVVHAPMAFAVLHPILQMVVLAPAVFLIKPRSREPVQVQLEYSGFLIALLTVSTLPASYHFTLLILPVTIITAILLTNKDYPALSLLLLLYLAVGYPAWHRGFEEGFWALAGVPRLYFLLLLCLLSYILLYRQQEHVKEQPGERWLWAAGLSAALAVQVVSNLQHQQGVYAHYKLRIPTTSKVILATQPITRADHLDFIAMLSTGYAAGSVTATGSHVVPSQVDQLSEAYVGGALWIEEAGRQSHIRSMESKQVEVEDGQIPVASPDGKWLAYLRSAQGRNQVWLRNLSGDKIEDFSMTPPEIDAEEMTFLPDGSLVLAALTKTTASRLYIGKAGGAIQEMTGEESRYPAASLDGQWLAYSTLQGGVWNLWLRDLHTGATRRLTNHDCNDTAPAWEQDSKTLVYASDCGRGLGLTALYRRRVVP